MKTYMIIFSGSVQGVFFRHHTRKKAEELNLKGYVRNVPDGTVEVVAQGDMDSIQKLIDYCRHGQPNASVADFSMTEIESNKSYDDFSTDY